MSRFTCDFVVAAVLMAALLCATTVFGGPWGPVPCPTVVVPRTAQKQTKVDTCTCPASCPCGCRSGSPCRCSPPDKDGWRKTRDGWWWREKPVAAGATPQRVAEDWQTSGAKRPQGDQPPSYRRNGRPCSKAEAHRAVQGSVTDDSGWLRVTAVGLPDLVRNDWTSSPALAEVRTKAIFQAYKADDPILAGLGFKVGLYVQSPDGRVLHRQDTYRGPEKLAEAIRKADPAYDPAKDPDLNKAPAPVPPSPSLPMGWSPLTWGLVLGLGALALFLYRQPKAAS